MLESKSNPMKKSIPGFLLVITLISLFSFATGTRIEERNNNTSNNINHKRQFLGSNSTQIHSFYQQLSLASKGLSENVFTLAYLGFEKLNKLGRTSPDSILTIIDFTKSSSEKRMYVVDLKGQKILFNTVVAHGRNSGMEFAKAFSNKTNSHQSSLGFYLTGDPYIGSNGYSLQLTGMEPGFNDKAHERAIVIHGAGYANESFIHAKGFLGRSYGCPALPTSINTMVINKIKKGNLLFIYYPDRKYLNGSEIING
jgi:hypothetical protein